MRCLLVILLLLSGPVSAQEFLQEEEGLYQPGHGSISLAFQLIEVDTFRINSMDVDIGRASTRSAYIEVEWAASSRWVLSAGLPWITKRYSGPAPHLTEGLDTPLNQARFLDDGHYHSDFQDWVLGANYLVSIQPRQVELFMRAHLPSHDYPHYAQAAIGQNLKKLELGAEVTQFLPLSDWYYSVSGSYVLVEQTLGKSINHFKLDGELGYFLGPEISVHGFVQAKDGRGFGPNFANRHDEFWYQHDRLVHHSYVNVGLGADWFFDERYQFNLAIFRSFWGKTVHMVDWAATVGITRYF